MSMDEKKPTRDEMMALITNRFPNIWMKPSEQFNGTKDAIWTGTDSFIDKDKKIPAFNDSIESKKYDLGVHVTLVAFLSKHGYYAEAYDCGTFFIYMT